MTKRKNILFFFTDDQRFDTIASLGNPQVNTPNLDKLVKSGTSFTHAHIPGGTSAAVCMPSRAMLHTGKTLFHLEKDGASIPEEHILLGQTLQKAGYRTFGTGKWHNGVQSFARSFSDGDEIFFGGMDDHWNVPVYHYDPSGKYETTCKVIDQPMKNNIVREKRCNHIQVGKHSSDIFCESAAEWLTKYNSEDPFFMYISFMAPHDPRSMPEEFLNSYDPDQIELPASFMEEHPFNYGMKDIRDEVLAPYPRTPGEIKKHIAEYYGMISHLDHELGKVIASLKKSGKYENTIIVFAGDNGLALGQHGLMGKQSCYEHSVRVPLIFSGPDIPENQKVHSYAYLLDIFPTLCDLTGIEIPESVDGLSLVPTLSDSGTQTRETLYLAFNDLVRGVKNGRYKMIEYRNDNIKETQLFDLHNDPKELENLYGREGMDEIQTELQATMHQFKEEWDEMKHPLGAKFWSRY
jgi:arylsulfatase A-like enzyme